MEEHYSITFEIFDYRLYVIYTDNIAATRASLNKKVGAPKQILSPTVDGLHCYNNLETDAFVLFTPLSSIGTIAHEVSHAIWRMFKYFGAKFENEIFAYHLGYTLDKILEFKKEIDLKISEACQSK